MCGIFHLPSIDTGTIGMANLMSHLNDIQLGFANEGPWKFGFSNRGLNLGPPVLQASVLTNRTPSRCSLFLGMGSFTCPRIDKWPQDTLWLHITYHWQAVESFLIKSARPGFKPVTFSGTGGSTTVPACCFIRHWGWGYWLSTLILYVIRSNRLAQYYWPPPLCWYFYFIVIVQ